MPPTDEQFDRSELRHKLMYDYKVPTVQADSALRQAEAEGEAALPGHGLVIRKVHSAPGLKFTLHGAGR